MTATIIWFRRDLRLHDNPALNWACKHSDRVLPVFIYAPDEEAPWQPGAASRWWLHHSLEALHQQLDRHGLALEFFSGNTQNVLEKIISKTGATRLVYNRLYEPHLQQRDEDLAKALANKVEVHSFESGVFFKPGSLMNNQGLPYKVYTPFYKKLRPLLDEYYQQYSITIPAARLKKLELVTSGCNKSLSKLNLLAGYPWHEKLQACWQPGEQATNAAIRKFLKAPVSDYAEQRDILAVSGTSQISPGLHFGEITPQQVYSMLRANLSGYDSDINIQSVEVYLKQLVWREFAIHILWHFPHTQNKPMNPRYKNTFWRTNKRQLQAWQRGETGVPLVDAGMKQLWETGWMHNRVRMIVSSFLTKNLGISWLEGARWFWDTLVDADLANNSMGWQWVAGCGVDAAPYYRIFNPVTQAKRFDVENKYINTWLPDPAERMREPVVDLADSRETALSRYKKMIN